jgi:putative ABC transport system substrate-binding protein
MNRRAFIAGVGSAVVWPVAVRAQQPGMPLVGYLYSGSAQSGEPEVAAFRKGLSEMGYAEGRNVAFEYRWADGQYDSLPALAADLVRRRVAVIAAISTSGPGLAAKSATSTIPIVFQTGADPVRDGLVSNLNRPGGNLTGVTSMNADLMPKRLGLLDELIPRARLAVLVNPKSSFAQSVIEDTHASALRIGRPIEVLIASTSREIDAAFASFVQNRFDGLVVSPDGFFNDRRVQLVALATRHAVPVIYWDRAFPEAGGLISYGTSITDQVRQAGVYVGRILKGDSPADLPILRATKIELIINLQIAKTIGLDIPITLLGRADEVIE